MMKTTYNEFGEQMIENRATMEHLDLDLLTTKERENYINICDRVAETGFTYIANNNPDNFPAFRSALHALFTFVGTETRILSLDAYSVRFIPAVAPYKVVKSKEYKAAEKAIRVFKQAVEWACEVSNVNPENPESVLFPDAKDATSFATTYFNADVQDSYNAVVKFFVAAVESEKNLQLKDLQAEVKRLEGVRDDLAAQKWHYYKDFKNPMLTIAGKRRKHIAEDIRKNIEDTMADMLNARELMTEAQLEREEAQVKGGKKQAKKEKEANK